MRILTKRIAENWHVRFPVGNPWKMPASEWLPVFTPAWASSATATDLLKLQYPGADVFTIVGAGKDLEQHENH